MPTKVKPPTILALDPGSQRLGVAVLRGTELRFATIRPIRSRRTITAKLKEVRRVIERLITSHQPAVLAMETPYHTQVGFAQFLAVTSEIKATAERLGLEVREYDPSFVRKALCNTERPTKRDGRYPIYYTYS